MSFEIDEENYIMHYGVLRRSGRYPWGSGETQYKRNKDFLDYMDDLRKSGMTEGEAATAVGLTPTQVRALRTIANAENRQADILQAQRMRDKGMSNQAIADRLGTSEPRVRALLKPGAADRANILMATSDSLRKRVDDVEYLDVGGYVETQLNISKERLSAAVEILKEEGYVVHTFPLKQMGTDKETTMKVLCKPGTTWKDAVQNKENIKQVIERSEDGGRTFYGIRPPKSISSDRVKVVYGSEGGAEADGLMYIRPGVKDLSLGGARYAQVRVAVDGTHYLKGMAIYKDDLPKGVDIMFNTNKENTGNKLDALKPMKTDKDGNIDLDNPFGAQIKPGGQILSKDKKSVESVMNIVNEEGDWDSWSRNLAPQMLSKQSPSLAKSQLELTYSRKKEELDEIKSLTNPIVRKKLLESYSDDVDAAAVHLKAAAMPRQATQVILPIKSLKDTECYAPNYRDGERLALIRYPHAGTFEIPEVTVNNRNKEAKTLIGDAKDAIGINSKVAARMSGADFDGDFVLAIPNNAGHVKSTPALEKLKNFDPGVYKYPKDANVPEMTDRQKGMQMGLVSNLITDMTIKGASTDEIARAVRHSMVVIDAQKHHLNYKQSAIDNGISQLYEKYQGSKTGGGNTLISKATSEERVPQRRLRKMSEGGPVDKKTGKLIWEETGSEYDEIVTRADGSTYTKKVKRTSTFQKLALTDDAHTLSSGSTIERIYADHSNRLKDLANKARLEAINTPNITMSKSAKTVYAKEVDSLTSQLNLSLQNKPRERQAQVLANTWVHAKRKANPDMSKEELKKIKNQAIAEARRRTGANKYQIEISDKEWEAIQAGAISSSKLRQILDNTDIERVKELATPRTKITMTQERIARARTMLASGYTRSEVADALGVNINTLKDNI